MPAPARDRADSPARRSRTSRTPPRRGRHARGHGSVVECSRGLACPAPRTTSPISRTVARSGPCSATRRRGSPCSMRATPDARSRPDDQAAVPRARVAWPRRAIGWVRAPPIARWPSAAAGAARILAAGAPPSTSPSRGTRRRRERRRRHSAAPPGRQPRARSPRPTRLLQRRVRPGHARDALARPGNGGIPGPQWRRSRDEERRPRGPRRLHRPRLKEDTMKSSSPCWSPSSPPGRDRGGAAPAATARRSRPGSTRALNGVLASDAGLRYVTVPPRRDHRRRHPRAWRAYRPHQKLPAWQLRHPARRLRRHCGRALRGRQAARGRSYGPPPGHSGTTRFAVLDTKSLRTSAWPSSTARGRSTRLRRTARSST